jgi:hypothetical protein
LVLVRQDHWRAWASSVRPRSARGWRCWGWWRARTLQPDRPQRRMQGPALSTWRVVQAVKVSGLLTQPSSTPSSIAFSTMSAASMVSYPSLCARRLRPSMTLRRQPAPHLRSSSSSREVATLTTASTLAGSSWPVPGSVNRTVAAEDVLDHLLGVGHWGNLEQGQIGGGNYPERLRLVLVISLRVISYDRKSSRKVPPSVGSIIAYPPVRSGVE